MSIEQGKKLFDEIESLLKKQIELAHHGNYGKLLELAGECELFVAKTNEMKLREKPQFKETIERLAGLYKELQLLLSAQQVEIAEQLKSISKGKRTLAIYQNNF